MRQLPLLIALEFLTVLPLRQQAGAEPDAFPRSVPFFPWVGLLLGLALVGLDFLLGAVLAPGVVNALLVVALMVLTGALHLDGLMDSCDGLLCAKPAEKRLEIMRDSRVGGFGVAGAVAVVLLKYAALGALIGPARPIGLLLAPTLARWAMVYAMVAFPYGRSQGLGSMFRPAEGRRALLLATVAALLIAVVAGGWRGPGLLVLVWLGTWLVAKFTMARIPGLTGDVYGAVNEIGETLVLLAAPAFLW